MSDALHINPADASLLHRTHYNLTNHPPNEDQIERIERLRGTSKRLASMIYVNCPKSRERSLALTNLEQLTMWAVASIAREGWEDEN